MRYILLSGLLWGLSSAQCSDFATIGNPINSISEYFSQMFKTLDPDNSQSSPRIVLVDTSVSQGSNVYKVIFEIKNEFQNSKSYIGLQATQPQDSTPGSPFRILKYVMTTDVLDLQSVLGMKNLKVDDGIFCRDIKKIFMDYFFKKNYDLAKKVYDYNFGDYIPSYSLDIQNNAPPQAQAPAQKASSSQSSQSSQSFQSSQSSFVPPSTSQLKTSTVSSGNNSGLSAFASVMTSLGLDLTTGLKPNGNSLTSAEFNDVASKLLQLKNTQLTLQQVNFIENLIDRISANEMNRSSSSQTRTQTSFSSSSSSSSPMGLSLPTWASFPGRRL